MNSFYEQIKNSDLLNLDPEVLFSIIVKTESTLGVGSSPSDVLSFSELSSYAIQHGRHPAEIKTLYWTHLLKNLSEFAEELGGCEKVTSAHMVLIAKRTKDEVFKNAFGLDQVESGQSTPKESVLLVKLDKWSWYPAMLISMSLTLGLWFYFKPYAGKENVFVFWPTGILASGIWLASRFASMSDWQKLYFDKLIGPGMAFVSLAWGGLAYQYLGPAFQTIPNALEIALNIILFPGVAYGVILAFSFLGEFHSWINRLITAIAMKLI